MKRSVINLTQNMEKDNIMRSLNSENTSIPSSGSTDKLSLWTLASDVIIDENTRLEKYYTDMTTEMAANEYQLLEMVEFLRSVGFGVTDHTDINTMAARLQTVMEPIFAAFQQITGKTLNDATPQEMVNLMQSIDTRLKDIMDKLGIDAVGTQEITDAIDSL